MKIKCVRCGTEYDLPPEFYGRKVECQCGHKFNVFPQNRPQTEPPQPLVTSAEPHFSEPSTPVAVIIVSIFAVLLLLAGAAGVGLGIKNYVETNNPFTLIPAAVGLLLLIYGGLAGCCSIMAGKLHRIEWYLARYFRQK